MITTNGHLHLVIKDYFKRLLILFYYCNHWWNLGNTHIVYDSKQPLTTHNVVVKSRGFKKATSQSPAQVLARCESSDENRILVVVIFHQTEDWLHGVVPSRPCLFSVNTSDVWLFCRLTDISLFEIALCLSMKQHGANCFIFITWFVFLPMFSCSVPGKIVGKCKHSSSMTWWRNSQHLGIIIPVWRIKMKEG